jgi:hypothetical protein
MKAAKAVTGGFFLVVMLAAVGGVAYMALKKPKGKTPSKLNPITAPLVNENVNPDLKPVTVQTATGYQDVVWQQTTVDTQHLDPFWQYQGLIR